MGHGFDHCCFVKVQRTLCLIVGDVVAISVDVVFLSIQIVSKILRNNLPFSMRFFVMQGKILNFTQNQLKRLEHRNYVKI